MTNNEVGADGTLPSSVIANYVCKTPKQAGRACVQMPPTPVFEGCDTLPAALLNEDYSVCFQSVGMWCLGLTYMLGTFLQVSPAIPASRTRVNNTRACVRAHTPARKYARTRACTHI